MSTCLSLQRCVWHACTHRCHRHLLYFHRAAPHHATPCGMQHGARRRNKCLRDENGAWHQLRDCTRQNTFYGSLVLRCNAAGIFHCRRTAFVSPLKLPMSNFKILERNTMMAFRKIWSKNGFSWKPCVLVAKVFVVTSTQDLQHHNTTEIAHKVGAAI